MNLPLGCLSRRSKRATIRRLSRPSKRQRAKILTRDYDYSERGRSRSFVDIEISVARESLLTNEDNSENMKNKIKLFEAVGKDDDNQCIEILEADPKLLAERNDYGDTVFHVAAREGHTKTMTQLLHFMDTVGKVWHKHPILHRTKDGHARAWHLAIEHRHKDMAFILVDTMPPEEAYDADVTVSTIELAIRAGYKDLVERMLLRAPWNSLSQLAQEKLLQSSSIVHDAINTKDIGMLKIVLDNMPALMESFHYEKGVGRRRPLSYAIRKGYYEEMCYMLDNFPDSVNMDAEPVIHTAVKGGNIEIVKEILSRFPESINHCNETGQRLLSLAAREGDINIVRYFLNEFPYCTTLCNEDGTYPIHEAVASGCVEVVEELLSHCPETLYQVDGNGRSVLHIVVEYAKPNVLSYLKEKVELKNILHLRDNNGNTCADLAKQQITNKSCYTQQNSNTKSYNGATVSLQLPKYNKRGFWAFLKKKVQHLMVCTRPVASKSSIY